jgi:ACS family hexuronate transporter-like MFS transporter
MITKRAEATLSYAPAISTWRWVLIGVFVASNLLNFLDRQLLAAMAPVIKAEFHLSNTEYGTLVSAFSLIYAAATPFAGLFVDRVGLSAGVIAAVGLWSAAAMATGTAGSFKGLMFYRGFLGLGEAGALPFLSKANATYLGPAEWGLASALGSLAVTGGSMAAPLLAATVGPKYGWRPAFVLAGALGIVWIAIWMALPKSRPEQPRKSISALALLRDPRMWRVIVAYPLVMAVLMLWLNWTTIFLVQGYHLTQTEANRYFAWIPPIFVAAGGFFNGWLAFRWISRGMEPLKARTRICIWCAPLFLITAAIPFLPSAGLAIAGVCLGLFTCQCVVGSLNILPLDLFGQDRAAFSISLLACSFSLMQTFVSPLIGALVDRVGFSTVCVAASILPIAGIAVVRRIAR